MNEIINSPTNAVTMSSLELVEFINSYRKELAQAAGRAFPSKGFSQLQHKDFLEKVPNVLGPTSAEFSADLPDNYGRARNGYRFPKREACLMAMSYSYDLQAKVFDRMTALEEQQHASATVPLSTEEMLLAQCQVMVDHKRRIVENEQAIARVEQRVEDLTQDQILTACPTHAESITHIRKRIGELYGLPARIIDYVMRQSPYAPKPAHLVKNTREEAAGATYEVFWVKDVSTIFKRFMAECVQVTSAQYTHPFLSGRFKIRGTHTSVGADLFKPESSP